MDSKIDINRGTWEKERKRIEEEARREKKRRVRAEGQKGQKEKGFDSVLRGFFSTFSTFHVDAGSTTVQDRYVWTFSFSFVHFFFLSFFIIIRICNVGIAVVLWFGLLFLTLSRFLFLPAGLWKGIGGWGLRLWLWL